MSLLHMAVIATTTLLTTAREPLHCMHDLIHCMRTVCWQRGCTSQGLPFTGASHGLPSPPGGLGSAKALASLPVCLDWLRQRFCKNAIGRCLKNHSLGRPAAVVVAVVAAAAGSAAQHRHQPPISSVSVLEDSLQPAETRHGPAGRQDDEARGMV
ncbi:hypothetical protein ABPG75_011904 [Micractinium tetrahymenae]